MADCEHKHLDEPSLTLVVSYLHLRPRREPKHLQREEIWIWPQLCRGPRSKVDIAQIARQTSFLPGNGLAFEVSRKIDQSDISQLSTSK